MTPGRIAILLLMLLLLGAPLLLRPATQRTHHERELIILTPHNEQIRYEFGRAFSLWHERRHGEPVHVIWSTPGGTSEIRRMLIAQYRSDLRDRRPVGGAADLLFGGGSYEFGELKKPITVEAPLDGASRAETLSTTILSPIAFDADWLREIYGENRIGDEVLYDEEGFWYGAALSGFGIVYNRDVLEELGIDEPETWTDLVDPRLSGWVALVNPGQSGSITTAFEAILLRLGWERGWRVLRRMAANARYFSASSPRAPVDVSLGDAAAGVCIDFYGRYQAQAVMDAGGGPRVGYVDPAGVTTIDADPIAMLRGAPHPETARRFIEFVLSEEGQALWQFPRQQGAGSLPSPAGADEPSGPERFELRRMPIRRVMFDRYMEWMIDRVDPFLSTSAIENPDRNVRSFIAILFAALAIDNHEELREAWSAIISHPAYPPTSGLVTAEDVSDSELTRMLRRFDELPSVPTPSGGSLSLGQQENLGEIKAGWLREGWSQAGLWPKEADPAEVLQRRWTRFFQENYRGITEIASE